MKYCAAFALLAATGHAFPWVADQAGVDSSMLGPEFARSRSRRQQPATGAGSEANCPFNPNHVPAAPISAQYPYNGAINGAPGKGQGGFQVPAPGDTAHQFVAPGANDIRGPCPGLNAAANHNFLAHDGIVTFNELVDAQQNIYNVGYDLAVLLAVLGLTVGDGDPVTMKLSIGCDATGRTSFNRLLTGSEPGLAGHNKFEADSSLTRNDYFTHGGDNFKFNATLFQMMTESTGGVFDRAGMSKYRKERYDQSRAENPNFYFGPFALLLYGASSFLYELMPSGTRNYAPDLETISSFFGASANGDGTFSFNNREKIPDNWTNRKSPLTIPGVGSEIFAQYLLNPVEFGGNTGSGSFNGGLNFGAIRNGKLDPNAQPANVACLLYQLTTERIPASLNGFVTPTVQALGLITKYILPNSQNLGCPSPLT